MPPPACNSTSRFNICARTETSNERAGDDHALALAAGELMRQQIGLVAPQSDLVEQRQHAGA